VTGRKTSTCQIISLGNRSTLCYGFFFLFLPGLPFPLFAALRNGRVCPPFCGALPLIVFAAYLALRHLAAALFCSILERLSPIRKNNYNN